MLTSEVLSQRRKSRWHDRPPPLRERQQNRPNKRTKLNRPAHMGSDCRQIGAKLGQKGTTFEGYSDVAMTLLARDYKGFGNQPMTGVIEHGRSDYSSGKCMPYQDKK